MQQPAHAPPLAQISIFDVDRTITKLPTYSAFLIFAALRLKPWRLLLLPLLLPWAIAYAAGWINRSSMKATMHRLTLGTALPRRKAERVAGSFAEKLLRDGLYREAIARLKSERAAGRRIILATAAPELYIRPLAAGLGIADVVASRCRWADDRLDPTIDGENCYGSAKLRMIADHLERAGIDRTRTHIRAFSDHVSDLPMLEWADDGIAVNASPALRRAADARGWQILDWTPAGKSRRGATFDARRFPA